MTADAFAAALTRYGDAVRAKDVAAYCALYDDDVHVFDMWGAWSLRGIAPWRTMTTEWFASLGSEYVTVGAEDAHADGGDDLVIGHAFITYTAWTAEGSRLRGMSNRITMGLRQRAGAWKIIHQHTSVPIDGATMQGMLQRQ
jgi:ketosteroid isomerase-like protein